MDVLTLSRWQFGITAAFHFIFPSFICIFYIQEG
jgi:cytochrome bd-type quinol oxidase subunit 1